MSVYMKNLGCSPTSAMVSLEYIMVEMHLNASDSSLKFYLLELPRLIYSQFKDF